MKCYKCGNEVEEGREVCPVCEASVINPSPLASKMLSLINGKGFIAICALLTISAASMLLSMQGAPVFVILGAIFLWIIYSKGKIGIVDVGSMRCFSGVVYAQYIFMNVLAAIIAVFGIILGAATAISGTSPELLNALKESMHFNFNGINITVTESMAIGFGWIMAASFVFASVVVIVVNLFSWRKTHRFVKSVYTSVQTDGTTPIVNVGAARAWFWVLGVMMALNALGSTLNILLLVSYGSLSAAYIIGAVLVDKHFNTKNEAE